MLKTVAGTTLAALATVVIALGGTSLGHAGQNEPESMTLDQIADRFESAYRDAPFIRITGNIIILESVEFTEGERLDFVHESSQDSMRVMIMRGNEIYSADSLHEGRVQEFVPDHPKRLVLTYDAENQTGLPWSVYGQDLDCVTGFASGYFMGPRSRLRPQWSGRIREGRLLGRETINGRSCFAIEWSVPERPRSSITFTVYIDAEDFLLRRIDRKQTEDREDAAPLVERWRVDYTEQELPATEEEIEWDVWPLVRDKVASPFEDEEVSSD